jgi:two-component system response regulator HydG
VFDFDQARPWSAPVTGSILIVDDEVQLGRALRRAVERQGHEASYFDSPEAALAELRARPFDVLLTDLVMPGIDGIELLRRAKRVRPSCEVVLMTAFATVASARAALTQGAVDYITKPFSPTSELGPLIASILSNGAADEPEAPLPPPPPGAHRDDTLGLVGRSAGMRALVQKLPRIAASDASVLVRGESGTGKELVADALHGLSRRRERPLVKVNCAALPESLLEAELFGVARGAYTGADRDRIGLFQAADGGTLFLDEVGELPTPTQAKLLRVLQDGEFHRVGDSRNPVVVDVRVVAATNRDLEIAVGEGSFRRDVYYRLNVVPVVLPPLRERRDDIEPLIDTFVELFAKGRTVPIAPAARSALIRYGWPGNVRELRNAIEHALVLGDGTAIEFGDLPAAVQDSECRREQGPGDEPQTLEEIEKRCILQALRKTGLHRTQAARLLGITRRTLGYRIRKYRLEAELEGLLEASETPWDPVL